LRGSSRRRERAHRLCPSPPSFTRSCVENGVRPPAPAGFVESGAPAFGAPLGAPLVRIEGNVRAFCDKANHPTSLVLYCAVIYEIPVSPYFEAGCRKFESYRACPVNPVLCGSFRAAGCWAVTASGVRRLCTQNGRMKNTWLEVSVDLRRAHVGVAEDPRHVLQAPSHAPPA